MAMILLVLFLILGIATSWFASAPHAMITAALDCRQYIVKAAKVLDSQVPYADKYAEAWIDIYWACEGKR